MLPIYLELEKLVHQDIIHALIFQDTQVDREKRNVNEMPVVFLPEESETECVAENRMSSFGFLAFVVQSINAVVNVANNINNNNNNRNNNNNDNNNNQVNTNIANSANSQDSMSMAGMGKSVQFLERIRQARDRVLEKIIGKTDSNEDDVVNNQNNSSIRDEIESQVLVLMEKLYKQREMKEKEENLTETSTNVYNSNIVSLMNKVKVIESIFYIESPDAETSN